MKAFLFDINLLSTILGRRDGGRTNGSADLALKGKTLESAARQSAPERKIRGKCLVRRETENRRDMAGEGSAARVERWRFPR
jgi:hypothetical protein